jgi:hypothetical protein
VITDVFLRWIVTALFVVSALECGYVIATERRLGAHLVGHVLHLVMALAMAVMAWPRGAALPTTAPMVFFALAALWFVGVALSTKPHRVVAGYYAVMMLAMAWMYAVMNGSLLPGQSAHHDDHTSTASGHGHHEMAGMNMPGMDMSGDAAAPGQPIWIDALNWLCTGMFAVAAVWWLYRFFAQRQTDSTRHHFGVACQAMMAAGMAVMFGVML